MGWLDPKKVESIARGLGIGDRETELRKEYAGAAREIFEAIERKVPQDFSGLYYDIGQKYSDLSTNALIAILAKVTSNEGMGPQCKW